MTADLPGPEDTDTAVPTSFQSLLDDPRRPARTVARIVLRVVAHLAAEVPVIVVAALQISKGWLPTSDDAVIAWRSWSVFSGPLPLDGQFTQISAGAGHTSFDLGPLQYYLLAFPVHIDPMHGLLWGSAVVIAGLAALAIEAAWAGGGQIAGALTALGIAVMTGTLIESTVNLAWNPSMGVYAFAATLAGAFAVARGRFGWLPVAVGTASLAAQCHMSFAVPAAGALAMGILLGVLELKRFPLWPLGVAVAVGVACFLAPLVQQLTGHPGNWSALASNLDHEGRTLGFGVGLRGIAAATSLPPSWWVHVPIISTISRYQPFESLIYDHSSRWGLTALLLCGAIAIGAWFAHRRGLAALAAISTVGGFAVAWTLGSVAVQQAAYLDYYLYFPLWPVGMAILATYAIAIWSVIAWVVQRVLHSKTAVGETAARRDRRIPGWVTGVVTIALAISGTELGLLERPLGSSPLFLLGWAPAQFASRVLPDATSVVAAEEQGGTLKPFAVEIVGGFAILHGAIDQSVAYLLATEGYPARVAGTADTPLGPAYRAPAHGAVLELSLGLHDTPVARWVQSSAGTR
ncbi:MAG: hypothetical protein ACLPYW_09100 [Acidimicrobiales bacterium]